MEQRRGANTVAIQVGYRKTQLVIAPNQFTKLDTKSGKALRFKPDADEGVSTG